MNTGWHLIPEQGSNISSLTPKAFNPNDTLGKYSRFPLPQIPSSSALPLPTHCHKLQNLKQKNPWLFIWRISVVFIPAALFPLRVNHENQTLNKYEPSCKWAGRGWAEVTEFWCQMKKRNTALLALLSYKYKLEEQSPHTGWREP